MPSIKKVEYLIEYILKITFDNNEIKIVNLKNFIEGEIFEPLKEIDYFKSVKVDEDIETICWDNGADFSPEFLYELGKMP